MSAPLEILTELAACLGAQILEDELTEPCFLGVLPGSSIAADFLPECMGEDSNDGMAWTRLISAYPAFAPGITVERPEESHIAGLGLDIEVGILRSIPLAQEGIDVETALEATRVQLDDMKCIQKAIRCCPSLQGRGDYLLNLYQPVGPLGGVVGGAFTVMVHFPS